MEVDLVFEIWNFCFSTFQYSNTPTVQYYITPKLKQIQCAGGRWPAPGSYNLYISKDKKGRKHPPPGHAFSPSLAAVRPRDHRPGARPFGFGMLVLQFQTPAFKQVQNGKTIPQRIGHIEYERKNHHAQAIRDFLGFDRVIVVRWLHGFLLDR